MNMFWVLLFLGGVSWSLTGALRHYALVKSIIDVPNERSSHTNPTPRGGGLAIVITFLSGLVFFRTMSILDTNIIVALMGAGMLVAIVGFMDDHSHIVASWRLLVHFCAACWLLFWLGGLPPLTLLGVTFNLGWAGNILLMVSLVWLLNLYNFMDGIDGIASVEALSATLVAGLLIMLVFDNQELACLYFLMSVSVAGFFVWNFPIAKIFMGDAGSGFLGLMLGAFAFSSAHVEQQMYWVWLILLGVFITDATYTLFRRLLRGDKIYEAHRSHAYQYASRKYGSHLFVTLSVLTINLFWLTPWAFAVAYGLVDGVAAVIVSYIPLLWAAWFFHAGELEEVGR